MCVCVCICINVETRLPYTVLLLAHSCVTSSQEGETCRRDATLLDAILHIGCPR